MSPEDNEQLERLANYFPEEFTETHKQLALAHLREITGKPYEQVAVLMAIQHMTVESLLGLLEASEKGLLSKKQAKNGRPLILPPGRKNRLN